MIEKEEKVIESFKRYIKFQESTIDDYYKMDEEYYKDQIEQLELSIQLSKTILNLIENQQIALEQKDKEIQELNADRVEKDKMIDLMSEFIWDYDCCNHFAENRVKCKMKGFETTLGNCKNNCIKQYFQKKVREENG